MNKLDFGGEEGTPTQSKFIAKDSLMANQVLTTIQAFIDKQEVQLEQLGQQMSHYGVSSHLL